MYDLYETYLFYLSESMCYLPKSIGTCRAAIPRVYYDATTGQCSNFIYGGCGGNQNNFESIEECNVACQGKKKSNNYSNKYEKFNYINK